MNVSSISNSFGTRGRAGSGGIVSGLRETFDKLRSPAEDAAGSRSDQGDLRAAVLELLDEQPMNGYEIVRVLAERRAGQRTPGPGSVYPTLQLLSDEGLATAAETDGKKTYSLTDSGRIAAEAAARGAATRASTTSSARPANQASARRSGLAKVGAQLAQTAALVAQSGSPQQIAEAVEVLDEARRRLLTILARN